jgi:hypothetical protein
VTGRWTGRGLCLTGRVWSAFSVYACFSLMIGRASRPVTVDRTRPVVQGAYWTPTGRWHYGIRSVLQRVRSLFHCTLLRLDQRIRSVTGPARLVNPSASGLRDEHHLVSKVSHPCWIKRTPNTYYWTSHPLDKTRSSPYANLNLCMHNDHTVENQPSLV